MVYDQNYFDAKKKTMAFAKNILEDFFKILEGCANINMLFVIIIRFIITIMTIINDNHKNKFVKYDH